MGRVIAWRTLKVEWSDWDERHGRKSREAAVREMGIDRIQLLTALNVKVLKRDEKDVKEVQKSEGKFRS